MDSNNKIKQIVFKLDNNKISLEKIYQQMFSNIDFKDAPLIGYITDRIDKTMLVCDYDIFTIFVCEHLKDDKKSSILEKLIKGLNISMERISLYKKEIQAMITDISHNKDAKQLTDHALQSISELLESYDGLKVEISSSLK